MNDNFKPVGSALTLLLLAALILWAAVSVPAGPPVPDDPTTEEDTDYGYLIQEELLRFSSDYVDLIDELEAVLDEFDVFFEDFGQTSIAEYEKAIEKLRKNLTEEYSAKSYEQIIEGLDNLQEQFEQLEADLEESDSNLQRRRLKNLKALEDDLSDIQEQLEEEVSDTDVLQQLDTKALAEVITKAFEEAQRAMREARRVHEERERLVIPVAPAPPEVPSIPMSTEELKEAVKNKQLKMLYSGKGNNFDGSISQTGNIAVDNRDIVVELENNLGGIEVQSWNRSEINIDLTIGYIEDSPKSRDLASGIKLHIDRSPTTARVSVHYPASSNESINIVSSRMSVSVPRENPVRIRNSFGPVAVSDIGNNLDIQSNFADIDVQNIKGQVVVANSSGPIYLEDITGTLEISNSFAPIEAVYVNGDTKVSNSYSPIRIEKSSGRLDINTSGDVSVNRHKGDAYIHSSNGNMEVYGVTGNLVAVNSFGQIVAEKISGDAIIENANANIEISGVDGNLTVSNNFAPITVDGIGREVTIKSSNCNVSVENVKAAVNVINRFGGVTIQSVAGTVHVVNSGDPVNITGVLAPVTVINQFSPVVLSTITGAVSVDNQNASVDLTDIKGSTRVKTSYGLVSADNLSGPFIIGNENGSVELGRVFNIKSDCEVTTTFGNIVLQLPPAGSYNLKAVTSYGEIESDIPMDVKSNGNIRSASLVAGQTSPTIILKGNNSTIKIKTE